MSMDTNELTAWLGPAADDLTDDQMDRLEDASRAIERRYPVPVDGELADVAQERDAALSAALQVILGEVTVEDAAEAYCRAQLAAQSAHAGQTGAIIAAAQTTRKADLARRTGLSRVSINKALTQQENSMTTQTYIDHAGQTLTVPAVDGLTTATWKDADGSTILEAPAWRYADGTLFIPADAQGPEQNSVDEKGGAIGQWVEATTGQDAVLFDGAPRIIIGGTSSPHVV